MSPQKNIFWCVLISRSSLMRLLFSSVHSSSFSLFLQINLVKPVVPHPSKGDLSSINDNAWLQQNIIYENRFPGSIHNQLDEQQARTRPTGLSETRSRTCGLVMWMATGYLSDVQKTAKGCLLSLFAESDSPTAATTVCAPFVHHKVQASGRDWLRRVKSRSRQNIRPHTLVA